MEDVTAASGAEQIGSMEGDKPGNGHVDSYSESSLNNSEVISDNTVDELMLDTDLHNSDMLTEKPTLSVDTQEVLDTVKVETADGSASIVDTDVETPQTLNEAPYRCVCGDAFALQVAFKTHVALEHGNKGDALNCALCGQVQRSVDVLVRHLRTHAASASFQLFRCPLSCRFSTNIADTFLDHMRWVHKSASKLVCLHCGLQLANPQQLVEHVQNALVKLVQCAHCDFRSTQRSEVKGHIRTEHKDLPTRLSLVSKVMCGEKGSPTKPAVSQKKLEPSPGVTKNVAAVPERRTEDGFRQMRCTKNGLMKFFCDKCSYTVETIGAIKRHVLVHDTTASADERFPCPYCPYIQRTSINKLRDHLRHHSGLNTVVVYKCLVVKCQLESNNAVWMRTHLMNNHGIEILDSESTSTRELTAKGPSRNYYVEIDSTNDQTSVKDRKSSSLVKDEPKTDSPAKSGNMKFTLQDLLHAGRENNGVIECFHCTYVTEYSNRHNMARHLIGKHSRVKPYKCLECGATFGTHDSLSQHFTFTHIGPIKFEGSFSDGMGAMLASKLPNGHLLLRIKDEYVRLPGEEDYEAVDASSLPTPSLENNTRTILPGEEIPQRPDYAYNVNNKHVKTEVLDDSIDGLQSSKDEILTSDLTFGDEDETEDNEGESISLIIQKAMKAQCTKVQCGHCDRSKSFGCRSDLIQHCVSHSTIRPFQCPRCPTRLAWYKQLKLHINSKHGHVVLPSSMSMMESSSQYFRLKIVNRLLIVSIRDGYVKTPLNSTYVSPSKHLQSSGSIQLTTITKEEESSNGTDEGVSDAVETGRSETPVDEAVTIEEENVILAKDTTCDKFMHDVTNSKKLFCMHCGMQSHPYNNMLNHVMSAHTTLQPYVCPGCDFTTSKRIEIKNHLTNFHRVTKDLMPVLRWEQLFDIFCYKLEGEKVTIGAAERIVQQKTSGTKRNLDANAEEENKRIRLSPERTTQTKKTFICPECGETQTKEWDMKRHVFGHTDVLPYQCEVCEEVFKTQFEAMKHCSTVHKQDGSFKELFSPYTAPEFQELWERCLTNSECSEEADAETVTPEVENSGTDSPVTAVRVFKSPSVSTAIVVQMRCPFCKFVTTQRKGIYSHLCMHLKYRPFKCNQCNLRFFSNSGGMKHVVSHHQRNGKIVKDLTPEIATKLDALLKKIQEDCASRRAEIRRNAFLENQSEPNVTSNDTDVPLSMAPMTDPTADYASSGSPAADEAQLNSVTEADPEGQESAADGASRSSYGQCPFCFEHLLHMRPHVMNHMAYRPYRCRTCHERYATVFAVKRHLKNTHNDLTQNYELQLDDSKEEEVKIILQQVTEQLKHQRNPSMYSKPTPSALFESIIKVYSAKRHMDITAQPKDEDSDYTSTTTPDACPLCKEYTPLSHPSKSVLSGIKGMMLQHLQNKHFDYRPFQCSECQMRHTSARHCRAHQMRIHNGSGTPLERRTPETELQIQRVMKPWYEGWLKVHASKETMRRSADVLPTEINPQRVEYICNTCPFNTGNREQMRAHLCSHAQYAPFQCSSCGAAFSRQPSCAQHCTSAHAGGTAVILNNRDPIKEEELEQSLDQCMNTKLPMAATFNATPGIPMSAAFPLPMQPAPMNPMMMPAMPTQMLPVMAMPIAPQPNVVPPAASKPAQRLLQCPRCSHKDKSKANMHRHLMSHARHLSLYECPVCGIQKNVYYLVYDHIKSAHRDAVSSGAKPRRLNQDLFEAEIRRLESLVKPVGNDMAMDLSVDHGELTVTSVESLAPQQQFTQQQLASAEMIADDEALDFSVKRDEWGESAPAPFKCLYCVHQEPTRTAVIEHITTRHPTSLNDADESGCPECDFKATYTFEIELHLHEAHPLSSFTRPLPIEEPPVDTDIPLSLTMPKNSPLQTPTSTAPKAPEPSRGSSRRKGKAVHRSKLTPALDDTADPTYSSINFTNHSDNKSLTTNSSLLENGDQISGNLADDDYRLSIDTQLGPSVYGAGDGVFVVRDDDGEEMTLETGDEVY